MLVFHPVLPYMQKPVWLAYSFSSYLFYTYYDPGTGLSTWNTSVYKTQDFYIHGTCILAGVHEIGNNPKAKPQ